MFLMHVSFGTYWKYRRRASSVAIFSFVQSEKERGRWVQTFLVVKGRNLQLSNKSLRLNPFSDWLEWATWHTVYEHELYAVVYSLVLPLYPQQTKPGRTNVFFIFIIKPLLAVILGLVFIRSPTS